MECIKHHGETCHGCGFNFGKVYGNSVKGYIQVHHLISLSDKKKEYRVDPIKDLIPLCANCHCVVHSIKPALTIEQLRKLVKRVNE